MTAWINPVPMGITAQVRVFQPGGNLHQTAAHICERAWKGQGVRVFRWADGTVAVVTVAGASDQLITAECVTQLLATYARHNCAGPGVVGMGPRFADVVHDLRWAAMDSRVVLSASLTRESICGVDA